MNMGNTKQQQALLPIDITFALVSLKCSSFNLTEYGRKRTVPLNVDGCEFLLNINFTVFKEPKQVQVTVESKMQEKLPAGVQRSDLATLTATGVFAIHNFDALIVMTPDKKNFLIPNPLIEICTSIITSSLRGMLTVKLEDTIYNNIVFPLIDTKTLLPKFPLAV